MTAALKTILNATTADVAQAVASSTFAMADGKSVNISAFQTRLFDVAFKQAELVADAENNAAQVMQTALALQYGDTAPTFKEFQADRAALRALAMHKGLVDDQWVRKPYNLAVKALWGALPVAMTEAAILKRAQRDAKPKAAVQAVAKPGAVKGDTAERAPSANETVEQLIARIGIYATIKAVTRILATERASATDKATLEAVAERYNPAAKKAA